MKTRRHLICPLSCHAVYQSTSQKQVGWTTQFLCNAWRDTQSAASVLLNCSPKFNFMTELLNTSAFNLCASCPVHKHNSDELSTCRYISKCHYKWGCVFAALKAAVSFLELLATCRGAQTPFHYYRCWDVGGKQINMPLALVPVITAK
jgi:hypothetical protein